jgi:hypothetical protein
VIPAQREGIVCREPLEVRNNVVELSPEVHAPECYPPRPETQEKSPPGTL